MQSRWLWWLLASFGVLLFWVSSCIVEPVRYEFLACSAGAQCIEGYSCYDVANTQGGVCLLTGAEAPLFRPGEASPEVGEETAPEETAPEEVAPEEMTPEEVTPEAGPEEAAPEEMTPEEMTPEEMTSEAGPEETTPETSETNPEQAPEGQEPSPEQNPEG